jgi:hypothetical protein
MLTTDDDCSISRNPFTLIPYTVTHYVNNYLCGLAIMDDTGWVEYTDEYEEMTVITDYGDMTWVCPYSGLDKDFTEANLLRA